VEKIEKLKPASIYDVIDPNFFIELGTSHDEYLLSKNYYEYYYAISKFYQPISILEIGVRFGYSLGSMVKGSNKIKKVVGIDLDSYEYNSLQVAESNIKKYINPNIDYNFYLKDSHDIIELDSFYDLIHVDGDHSYEGKIKDLNLAVNHCKTLIIDDYNQFEEVRNASDYWTEKNKEYIKKIYVLNSIRGTLVVEMK